MKELKENPQVRFHPGGGCLRWPETPHLAPAAENCTMSCCCYPWIQGVTLLRHAERGEGTERWLSHTHTNTLKRTCKRVHRRSSFLPLHGRLPSHRQNHHGHESVMKAAAWQILSNGYTYTYETPTNGYATNTQNWPPRRILPIVHFLRLLMIIEAWLPGGLAAPGALSETVAHNKPAHRLVHMANNTQQDGGPTILLPSPQAMVLWNH